MLYTSFGFSYAIFLHKRVTSLSPPFSEFNIAFHSFSFGANRVLLLHFVTYLAKRRGALGHAVVGPVGLHAIV